MKNKNVSFVTGAHGVGKGYLCGKLAPMLNAEHITASSLIRKRKLLGPAKAVEGIEANQIMLIEEFFGLSTAKPIILLDGHLCLYDSRNKINALPVSLFLELGVKSIVLVVCDPNEIFARINKRDHGMSALSLNQLDVLQAAEKECSQLISQSLCIPLIEVECTQELTSEALKSVANKIERDFQS